MRHARCARLLVCLALPGLPAAETAKPPGDPPAEPESGKASPRSIQPLPWKEDTTYHFIWIRGSEKVGASQFRIRGTTVDGAEGYEIQARRSYEAEGRTQRATSSTRLLRDGAPVRYEESMDLSTLQGLRAHQDTTIEVAEGKARVRFVPNGREERAARFELPLARGTFLFAGQSVEHWALFTAALPAEAKTCTLLLLYPDYRKTFEVTFTREEPETLTVAGEAVTTRVYAFRSAEGQLQGTVWVAEDRRLVQILFPDPTSGSPGLRVTLADSKGRAARSSPGS